MKPTTKLPNYPKGQSLEMDPAKMTITPIPQVQTETKILRMKHDRDFEDWNGKEMIMILKWNEMT